MFERAWRLVAGVAMVSVFVKLSCSVGYYVKSMIRDMQFFFFLFMQFYLYTFHIETYIRSYFGASANA